MESAMITNPDMDRETIELLKAIAKLVNEAYYKGLQDGQKTR